MLKTKQISQKMTNRVIQSQCNDTRLDAMTQTLLQQAIQCVTTKGFFNLVLSDSNLLNDVYARLMYDPDLRAMPWNETHLWFLRDEEESIVHHSGIPEENVHSEEMIKQIDCCLLAGDDVQDVSRELQESCTAFLILASGAEPPDWQHCGVAHWFC
jgi:hypothetical protein